MKWIKQFTLSGQVAIVTGATGGLGQEVVKILIDAGANVVVIDINGKDLQRFVKKLPKKRIIAQQADVTNKSAIQNVIKNTHHRFGKINILVNCAGILGSDVSMFDMKEKDWDRIMDVNVKGTWMISTEVAKYMIEHDIKGKIIMISSSLGLRAQLNRIAYSPSKAAVEHLARNMAMELVPYEIRVNVLAPGWMKTEMTRKILSGSKSEKWSKMIPMRRAAEPAELAGALLLLASDASSYMTGSIVRVDGGYSHCGIELLDEFTSPSNIKPPRKISPKSAATRPQDVIPDSVDTGEFHGVSVRKGTIKAAIENAKILESKQASSKERKEALEMISKLAPDMIALELDQHLSWKNKKIQAIFDKLKQKRR